MLPIAVLLAVGLADPPAPPAGAKNAQLREELLARMKKDQDARFRLIEAMTGGKKPPPAELDAVAAIDKENREWLKGVVEKHGWPGRTLVGKDGANAAWLMVQHADPDVPFQKKCLGLLKAAVTAGEAEAKDLAYLTDRVRANEGKQQLYGTQLVEKDGRFVPKPIEDEVNVDKRRKEIGLPPLAQYIQMAEEMYRLKKDASSGGKKP